LHNDAIEKTQGEAMPRGMMKGMGGRMMGSMMDPRSRFFMALSSDQRLRIIEMLKSGEKTLADFTKDLQIDVSVVSRHLMMLRGLGIVSARREGAYVYFNIADKRIFDVIALSNQIISDWFKQNQQMFQ
jgi:DNA-binding transcriptional ArsR family regulator